MKSCTVYFLVFVAFNLLTTCFIYLSIDSVCDKRGSDGKIFQERRDIRTEPLAVMYVEFEAFENHLNESIVSLCHDSQDIHFFIVTEVPLYPPLQINEKISCKISVISTRQNPSKFYEETRPEVLLNSKRVLILPDGVQISSTEFRKLLDYTVDEENKIRAFPLNNRKNCLQINLEPKTWTVTYRSHNVHEAQPNCDSFDGDAIFIFQSETLRKINEPFKRPFALSTYLQAKFLNIPIVFNTSHNLEVSPLRTEGNEEKRVAYNSQRLEKLYRDFRIKKVIAPNGEVQMHGCKRHTPRCYGSVKDDIPEYLYERRWAPPCCLEHLRETARHVFKVLETYGIRYWLEGGSLLGALRGGDIIPWDNDVDVGVYLEDLDKLAIFKACANEPIKDELGFLWEKAIEGDFYRVHYSDSNRVHVDIFPFYSSNGTMTKDSWFATHRQDTEFPEHFLTPLVRVGFINATPYGPNNARNFLEFKFGKGVIEKPAYPGAITGAQFPEPVKYL